MGWGFSSLVSCEGLLLFPGRATFIKAFWCALPSDWKVLLDFPMSASFGSVRCQFKSHLLRECPSDHPNQSSFYLLLSLFMIYLGPLEIQALLRTGSLICGLLVSAMVRSGKQKRLYWFHVGRALISGIRGTHKIEGRAAGVKTRGAFGGLHLP